MNKKKQRQSPRTPANSNGVPRHSPAHSVQDEIVAGSRKAPTRSKGRQAVVSKSSRSRSPEGAPAKPSNAILRLGASAKASVIPQLLTQQLKVNFMAFRTIRLAKHEYESLVSQKLSGLLRMVEEQSAAIRRYGQGGTSDSWKNLLADSLRSERWEIEDSDDDGTDVRRA
jgi:hypothetical protein